MKFFYLRNKETRELVTAYHDFNDEGSWVELDYGYSNPYFSQREDLEYIAEGKAESTWAVEISSIVLKDASNGLLEVCEVEL